MKKVINIHYGEIALKGLNRGSFEAQLIQNVERALHGIKHGKAAKKDSRLVIPLETDAGKAAANGTNTVEAGAGEANAGGANGANAGGTGETVITDRLRKVFGIEWFAFAYETEREMGAIKEAILAHLAKNPEGAPFKVETNRSDKSFALKSPEISSMLGKAIDGAGYETELVNQKTTITVEILKGSALVSFGRVPGPGGLPVGSSGKVLCLLSGGIDSPVAALRMMKRGCSIELLHFHQFAKAEEVRESKMAALLGVLRGYGFDGKLYLAPYSEFYGATFSAVDPRKELVLFRRFILRVANALAAERGALGIVTGDSLAQVASQTLENLYATNEASVLPVFRPLVGYDKREIIDLAKKYGTYELSLKEYKDCCSLVAIKHPDTRVKLADIKKIENAAAMDDIVKRTKERIVSF